MADKYMLECPSCGAETDAPGSALGGTVECHACGEDVPVSEAHILRKQAADPDRRALAIERQTQAKPSSVSAKVEAAFGADEDDEDEPVHPTYAKPEPPRHSPMREFDQIATGPGKCVRCGRDFRGDWDQFETAEGTICYVCSNLAVEGVPERVRKEQEAKAQQPQRTAAADRLIEYEPPPPPPKEFFLGYDTTSPEFRRVVIGAGIATVAIAYLVMMTGWGTPEIPRSVGEPVSVEDLPTGLGLAWTLAYRVAGYLVVGVTIYLVLWRRNALPHESLGRNALDIGLVLVICAVVGLVFAYFASLVNYGGDVGWGPAAMVYVVSWIVQGLIVFRVFDWRLTDIFWAIFFFLIARFLVSATLQLVFGGLVHLTT